MSSPPALVKLGKLILLAVFVALASIVGLAPASFFLRSPTLLYWFAVEGIIVAGVYLFALRSETVVGGGAGILEYLLRGLAAVSFWGFLGVIWLILYGILYGVLKLVGLLITWLGIGLTINTASLAFYISFGFALLFGTGIAVAIAQNITSRLYSANISSRTVAYSQALGGQGKTWMYLVFSLLALSAMGALLWWADESRGFWFYFGLQCIPYVSCLWLLGLGVRVRKDSEVVKAIGMLLRATGYDVIFSPHSQDATVQTLLSGVDMIATRGNQALIIQVKTGSSSAVAVDWTAGSGLRMKAKALQLPDLCQKVEVVSLINKEVEPLMVLSGRDQDESLAQFSQEHFLPVVTIEMAMIDRILALADVDELRALAQKYFPRLAANRDGSSAASEEHLTEGKGQWA